MTNQKLIPHLCNIHKRLFFECIKGAGWILVCGFTFYIFNFAFICFAQEDLEQLKGSYFNQHRYSEFIDYLKGTKKAVPAQVSYYIALSRYEQLKYLESMQMWDEYFTRSNDYRQELVEGLQNAIKLASKESPLFVYARCLSWQFHKDIQDGLDEQARKDLIDALQTAKASLGLSDIKYVADKLFEYGERIFSERVYDIYLERLVASAIENKEAKLVSLAEEFAYEDEKKSNPYLAEGIFKKIEELNPDFILGEQTQYLRAYNLEKIKQYPEAAREYQILLDNYPKTKYRDEAIFKIGVITAYVLKDIPLAEAHFTEVAKSSSLNPQVIAGLYQLGLLSQYRGDNLKAKEYYSSLIDKSKEIPDEDLLNLTKRRLKEIEENLPLEFNLKVFLDARLKNGLGSTNVDIKPEVFRLKPNELKQISAIALPQESGCMPVNLEYLWSGDLGKSQPLSIEEKFSTTYIYPGTKLIQLVVVSPSGILGSNFVFLDVGE